MSLRFEPTPDDPARGAFLFGPIVLAADLGAEGLDARARYGPSAPEVRLEELPPAPVLVAASPAEALARVKPAPGPLASARTASAGRATSTCGRSSAWRTGATRSTSTC